MREGEEEKEKTRRKRRNKKRKTGCPLVKRKGRRVRVGKTEAKKKWTRGENNVNDEEG